MTIADVGYVATKIPRYDVAGQIVLRAGRNRQRSSLALEEDHQVGHAAVINVRVRVSHAPLARIFGEVPNHVFVNLLLQIDSHGSINTDDFVGTNAGARGHIAVGVVDANIVWKVTDHVLGALDGGSNELSGEALPGYSC